MNLYKSKSKWKLLSDGVVAAESERASGGGASYEHFRENLNEEVLMVFDCPRFYSQMFTCTFVNLKI